MRHLLRLLDGRFHAIPVGSFHRIAVEQNDVIAELGDLTSYCGVVRWARHAGGQDYHASFALGRRELLLRMYDGSRGEAGEHANYCCEAREDDHRVSLLSWTWLALTRSSANGGGGDLVFLFPMPGNPPSSLEQGQDSDSFHPGSFMGTNFLRRILD